MVTKYLTNLPEISNLLIWKYLSEGSVAPGNFLKEAKKHRMQRHEPFKEIVFKNMLFIVRRFVSAEMKKERYYVHTSHNTGDISYGKYTCNVGAGRCCKYVAACLYRLVKFFDSDKRKFKIIKHGLTYYTYFWRKAK